ncbi:hypothetical protein [Cellulosimicrobium sp. 22601]|uniref:hypothetical protein n=1 Tax=unclassified Cellulosimicrobium TaxID=2624466 RepID=UPI003F848306
MTTATLPRTAHRRATVPDPARLLRQPGRPSCYDDDETCARCRQYLNDCVCDDNGLDVQILHLLIGADLDAIRADVAGMRDDLDETRAAARYEAAFAEMESLVYLHAALDPDITETDILVRAAWALHLGAHDGIAGPDEALRLAIATLRGWTHRQALAAGGAR